MIYFGSEIHGEYSFVGLNLKNCCVGASFSINQIFIFAIGKLFKMRTVMWWTGTDVKKYNEIWHYRWRFKLFERFIDKHYAQAPWLKEELKKKLKKPVKVMIIQPTWVKYEDSLLFTKRRP